MKPHRWSVRFEKACRQWQGKLGLTDWTILFKVGKESEAEADVVYNCTNRHATITSYITSDALSPERIALHEMLHLLFADMLEMAGQKGGDHADVGKEEHRAIERLLNTMDGKP